MSHDTHVIDNVNKDLVGKSLQYYLDLAGDWVDPYGLPQVHNHDGFNVVRDDLIEIGSKGRFADLYVSRTKADHFVYVAPRVGYAGISLARVCAQYGRRLTLFAPASKQISEHQALALSYGAEMRFVRIASMPVLNKYAAEYAAETGAQFIPLGLKDPLVTAAIVKTCRNLAEKHGEPQEVWSAISTGVLSRGLQIGWPNAKFHAVAVARNLKAGELGRASVTSYPKPFQYECKTIPPFPSIKTYDAKAWETMQRFGSPGAWFWNVASELSNPLVPDIQRSILSQRDWNDLSDVSQSKQAIQWGVKQVQEPQHLQ